MASSFVWPGTARTACSRRFGTTTISTSIVHNTAVARQPDSWSELTVDGTTFPRTKIGAVPYAIEAEHAKSASAVTGEQASTLTQLKATVTSLQQSQGMSTPPPIPPPAPSLKYRFVRDGAGCSYAARLNSTVCQCEAGEILVSPGAWAGPNGALNASRHQIAPDVPSASDADRAREWTFSCVTLSGEPVQCQFVQAMCMKL
jgi:hypothetical protein